MTADNSADVAHGRTHFKSSVSAFSAAGEKLCVSASFRGIRGLREHAFVRGRILPPADLVEHRLQVVGQRRLELHRGGRRSGA